MKHVIDRMTEYKTTKAEVMKRCALATIENNTNMDDIQATESNTNVTPLTKQQHREKVKQIEKQL